MRSTISTPCYHNSSAAQPVSPADGLSRLDSESRPPMPSRRPPSLSGNSGAFPPTSPTAVPAAIVITYDVANRRRLDDSIVRARAARKFLKEWRLQLTRRQQDPPLDIELEAVLTTKFDWPGYLTGRIRREQL